MLFLVSFLLVFISSYFIASTLTKKSYEHFAILLISAFANIVLTFEILSLFKAISPIGVIALNIIIFISSLIMWIKNGKKIFIPNFRSFIHKYLNICKLDKTFIVLTGCFLVLLIGAFVLCLVMPITNSDALDYHVARSMFYINNASLNHFDVADVRLLVFPINSEILYAWILMLLKKDALLGFVSFFGFIFAISSVFKMMKLLAFSLRKILWSIFLVSSFASIIVQISGTETDVFTSSLVLSSIVLFWISLKEKNTTNLIFSALAYGLAIGVKTTSIIAIPAVALIMLFLSNKYKDFKSFAWFCLYCTVSFLVFSSYNYILNFIDYGNIMGTTSSIVVHKNFFGIKGAIANFIRHIFLFIDFSGFKWAEYIGANIYALKIFVLSLFNVDSIPVGVYDNPNGRFQINGSLIEPRMSFGILGFIVLLPCMIYAMIKPFFVKNFKSKFLAILSVSFIIYMLVLSYIIVYMNFNARFLAMFTIIATPILSYTYYKKNNLYKVFIVLCMFYYMVLVSSHLWARPWWNISKLIIYKHETISDIRNRGICANFINKNSSSIDGTCLFWAKLKSNDAFKNKRILYFVSSSKNLFIPMFYKYVDGLNIDIGLIENFKNYDINNYDYIVFTGTTQYATYFNEDNVKINYNIIDYKEPKIELVDPKEDYYCFYRGRNKAISKSDGEEYLKELKNKPFAVECVFGRENMLLENFDYIQTVSEHSKYKDILKEFLIYRNKKLSN